MTDSHIPTVKFVVWTYFRSEYTLNHHNLWEESRAKLKMLSKSQVLPINPQKKII